MNNNVTVSGMAVTTKVSSNLLISQDNVEANFAGTLSQTRQALLEPSSTINAIDYYYTSTANVKGNGDAKNDSYTAYDEDTALSHDNAGKTAYDDGFNSNYGISSPAATATGVAYGYVDYTFYLKAYNTEADAQDLKLTELNLKYNNGIVSDKAWRVALIAQSATAGTPVNDAAVAANVVSIFTLPGATNFAANTAVSGPAAVSTLSYGSSKTAYNQSGVIGSIAVGATAYYKVILRLWLEGEDTSCTVDTYATLTNAYTLDVKFELATETAASTCINKYGVVALGAEKDENDNGTATTTVDGSDSVKTLYAYTTTAGFTVYSDDAEIDADSVFYSLSGTAATTIAENQAALK